jgi:uncharacterized protein (DUF2461 family)
LAVLSCCKCPSGERIPFIAFAQARAEDGYENSPFLTLYLCFHLAILNNISILGSGLWHPEADKLALLREDIDGNSQGLKSVLKEERLRREFFDGIPDDEDKAVKAFVSQNSESALKTKPKVRTCFYYVLQCHFVP